MSRRTDLLSSLFSGLRIVHRTIRPVRRLEQYSLVNHRSLIITTYHEILPSRVNIDLPKSRSQLRRRDPYHAAQAKARRAANLSRQEVLTAERANAAGDPVRGITTPFLESFDTANRLSDERSTTQHLNHFLTEQEFQTSIQSSNLLTSPLIDDTPAASDPAARDQQAREHAEQHANAREALARITALDATSSRDRTHINIARCIDTFGRHNTDLHLRPKPPSTSPKPAGYTPNEKTPRAGPDTGSSEVQIAVLTAKIRTLANFLDGRGRRDKANKRNLRLLVHRRQKLLRYFRRKERGGERWQHLTNTLGLMEGTWKGEIVV